MSDFEIDSSDNEEVFDVTLETDDHEEEEEDTEEAIIKDLTHLNEADEEGTDRGNTTRPKQPIRKPTSSHTPVRFDTGHEWDTLDTPAPMNLNSRRCLDWSELKRILEDRDPAMNVERKINKFMYTINEVVGLDGHSHGTTNYVYYKVPPDNVNNPKRPRLIHKSVPSFLAEYHDQVARVVIPGSYNFMDFDIKMVLETSCVHRTKTTKPQKKKRKVGRPVKYISVGDIIDQMDETVEEDEEEEATTLYIGMVKLWHNHPKKRRFNAVVFNPFPQGHPNAPADDDLNFFRDFDISRKTAIEKYQEFLHGLSEEKQKKALQGVVNLFRHIAVLWGKETLETVEWWDLFFHKQDYEKLSPVFMFVVCWFAHLFVRPWELPGVSLYVYGPEGTGKGCVFQWIGTAIGPEMFQHTTNVKDIGGDFTSIFSGTLFLFADEANDATKHAFDANIKGLITENRLRLRQLFKDVKFIRNFMRIAFSSNKITGVPYETKRRRFQLISVDQRQSPEYYKALHEAAYESNGQPSMSLYLFMYVLYEKIAKSEFFENWCLYHIPLGTPLADKLVCRSLESVGKWLLRRLEQGFHVRYATLCDRDHSEVEYARKHYSKWDDHVVLFGQHRGVDYIKLDEIIRKPTAWVSMISVNALFDAYTIETHDKHLNIYDFKEQVIFYLPHVEVKLVEVVHDPVYNFLRERNQTTADLQENPRRVQVEYFELGYLHLCIKGFCYTQQINPERFWQNLGEENLRLLKNVLKYPWWE